MKNYREYPDVRDWRTLEDGVVEHQGDGVAMYRTDGGFDTVDYVVTRAYSGGGVKVVHKSESQEDAKSAFTLHRTASRALADESTFRMTPNGS